MIKSGSQVKIHYTLTVDGETVDSSRGNDPLAYTHGQGQIIPGLEEQIEGLAPGDTKEAVVAPEEGYGMPDPDGVQEVPKSAFNEPDSLGVGDVVSGQAGDRPIQARISEVRSETIVVDLNHPLAGKTLHFSVEIVEVG